MALMLFGYLILINTDSYDFISPFFLSFLVSILRYNIKNDKTVFNHISKHLEVRQKYSAVRRIFALFSVFDLLLIDNAFL